MKIREIGELKTKSSEELKKLIDESRARLRDLKFDLVLGKVKNVTELRNIKKNIARMLTFLKINSPP